MNFLKKGPEIKLSEIRVPGFVLDVYYDLKERHLLPVAAVLLVAIVAVPIALGQSSGSEEGEGAGTAPAAATGAASGNGGSGQLVARSAPGLRDYRRRLQGHSAKNPFKQQYVKSESESSGGGSTSGSGSGGGATETSTSTGTSAGGTSTETGGETETTSHSKLTYYSYAIDVRVTTGGSSGEAEGSGAGAGGTSEGSSTGAKGKTTVRRNLPELTMLPSRKAPAVVYMGSTKDGKKALMVVSSNVTSIFGDAKCVLGSQTCEMIAMEPGLPETLVYGGNGRTFKIELLKIRLVETDKINRAPLGKSKQGKKNSKSG